MPNHMLCPLVDNIPSYSADLTVFILALGLCRSRLQRKWKGVAQRLVTAICADSINVCCFLWIRGITHRGVSHICIKNMSAVRFDSIQQLEFLALCRCVIICKICREASCCINSFSEPTSTQSTKRPQACWLCSLGIQGSVIRVLSVKYLGMVKRINFPKWMAWWLDTENDKLFVGPVYPFSSHSQPTNCFKCRSDHKVYTQLKRKGFWVTAFVSQESTHKMSCLKYSVHLW